MSRPNSTSVIQRLPPRVNRQSSIDETEPKGGDERSEHLLFRFLKRKTLEAVRRLSIFAAICLLIQALMVAFSAYHPFLEVANHFLMHGIAASVLVLPLLCWFRVRATACLLTVSLLGMLIYAQPWVAYWASQPVPDASQKRTIRVLSWNVLAVNESVTEVNELIEESDADVVVLIETRPGFLEQLPILANEYPYSERKLAWGGSGIAIFSRLEGTDFEFLDLGFPAQPALVAEIRRFDSPTMKIVGLHTLSPLPLRRTYIRNGQFDSLMRWSSQQMEPVCVCGDFNATPWTKPTAKA